jgi:hypothetical protein
MVKLAHGNPEGGWGAIALTSHIVDVGGAGPALREGGIFADLI